MIPRTHPIMAVHLLLERDGKHLLSLRRGTGWMDGHFSVVAGHVEGGEPAREALCREAREEASLELDPRALRLVHTMHRRADQERLDLFFTTELLHSEPKNNEPERCGALGWFDLASLEAPLVPYIALALERWRDGERYSEHGW